MDRYTARLTAKGTTARERAINKFKRDLTTKSVKNGSCKTVEINGEERQLIINSGTQPYYKKYCTLPDETIEIGDYVRFANSIWLVMTRDSDDEIYIDGQMHQCNYLLKWQNEKGDIVERWVEKKSASKYNDGENGNSFIVLGSDQLAISIPVDEETIKLKKEMKIKFFIDENKTNPTVYELTGTGSATSYNGHGIADWIVKECAYTPTEEEIKLGVCNYKPKDNATETVATIIPSISCTKKSIKYGSKRTFTPMFVDEQGNTVDVVPVWEITNCSFMDSIHYEEKDGAITIYADKNYELWGKTFDLTLSGENTESITISIEITE